MQMPLLLAGLAVLLGSTACTSPQPSSAILSVGPSPSTAASAGVSSPDGTRYAEIRWGEDGRRIFIALRRGANSQEVAGQVPFETRTVVVPQGTTPRRVSVQVAREGDVESLTWSRNGERVIYSFRDSRSRIGALFSIGAAGGDLRQLTPWGKKRPHELGCHGVLGAGTTLPVSSAMSASARAMAPGVTRGCVAREVKSTSMSSWAAGVGEANQS